jgi:hypothetical protein
VLLATAAVDPPEINEHVPVELGLPMPRPIVIVDGGPAETNVMLTLPATVTVKE